MTPDDLNSAYVLLTTYFWTFSDGMWI